MCHNHADIPVFICVNLMYCNMYTEAKFIVIIRVGAVGEVFKQQAYEVLL